MKRTLTTVLGAATALLALSSTAGAEPQGYIAGELGVGYFYGTFGEDPNLVLLAGGTAEEFCADSPDDPFGSAEPGSAPLRLFFRKDGAVDLKVNDKGQPIHVYESGPLDAPPWIAGVCDGDIEPALVASGTADLKVRISVESPDLVDVFNSVNGTATGVDGTEYKIRAWADLVVENGVPVGSPEDFVGFEMHEIRR